MASAELTSAELDRDVVRGFAEKRTAAHAVSCSAMLRLLDGTHTDEDIERLEWFVAKRAEEFPITADALARLLNKGE